MNKSISLPSSAGELQLFLQSNKELLSRWNDQLQVSIAWEIYQTLSAPGNILFGHGDVDKLGVMTVSEILAAIAALGIPLTTEIFADQEFKNTLTILHDRIDQQNGHARIKSFTRLFAKWQPDITNSWVEILALELLRVLLINFEHAAHNLTFDNFIASLVKQKQNSWSEEEWKMAVA